MENKNKNQNTLPQTGGVGASEDAKKPETNASKSEAESKTEKEKIEKENQHLRDVLKKNEELKKKLQEESKAEKAPVNNYSEIKKGLEEGEATKQSIMALEKNPGLPKRIFKIKDLQSKYQTTKEYKERVPLGVDESGNRVWGLKE